jgi:hypothetical protein
MRSILSLTCGDEPFRVFQDRAALTSRLSPRAPRSGWYSPDSPRGAVGWRDPPAACNLTQRNDGRSDVALSAGRRSKGAADRVQASRKTSPAIAGRSVAALPFALPLRSPVALAISEAGRGPRSQRREAPPAPAGVMSPRAGHSCAWSVRGRLPHCRTREYLCWLE